MFCRHTQLLDFYPRPPRGGRPHPVLPAVGRSRYFYPRPPRGERLGAAPEEPEQKEISIHALREESDQYPCWRIPERRISIHALREESDQSRKTKPGNYGTISIHALREESDSLVCCVAHALLISIHALREESDQLPPLVVGMASHFYPRPPRGERPRPADQPPDPANFYPRPPRGERLCRRGFAFRTF